MNRRGGSLALAAGALVALSAAAEEPGIDGPALVRERCAGCHALAPPAAGAAGDLAALDEAKGPDLSYAGTKFEPAWIEEWLVAPTRLRPAGYLHYRAVVTTPEGDCIDPAKLPVHPALSPDEARAVAAFLGTLRREPPPYPIAEPNANIRAEVQFHKLLPCGGCHQSRPGQGGLTGPELYTAWRRLRVDWTNSFIADPVSWGAGQMPKVDLRSDLLASLSAFLFPSQVLPSGPAPAPRACTAGQPPPPVHARAETLYRLLCSQCHGVLGNGKGLNARALFIAPRNHTSPQEMEMLRREGIIAAIRGGGATVGKSTLMPAWGARLSSEDIELLADHVMRLSRPDPAPKPEP